MNARALALEALRQWRSGTAFADAILQQLLARSQLSAPDRAFATELFYGTIRNLSLLDFWIAQLRTAALDHASRDLLRLGLYQLFFLQTPSHAAVFETVALSGRGNRGLINGVLRSASRRANELQKLADEAPQAVRLSHPEFLLARWRAQFGDEQTQALCQWNNRPAPIYARVNTLRIDFENLLSAHPEAEPVAERLDFAKFDRLPTAAIARGDCYIQDPSTAIACEMLAPQPGETVLDACAAPGGKTALLAQMMENRGALIACEREPRRLVRLQENLTRLGAKAEVLPQDWSNPTPTKTFDRILVDAPCTNTGVIRRRIDVRWRLTSDDFRRMRNEQLAILRAVIPLLKADGVLVYSTCSLETEENEEVVREILHGFPDVKLESQKAVLPFRDGFDGAFAARFRRLA